MTPTKLRSERALKVGGIGLSAFGVVGGIVGLAAGDVLKVLLGFADLILGGIFYVHATADRRERRPEMRNCECPAPCPCPACPCPA